ncbi:MAG: hypothetical protein V2A67_07565 [Bacteroidota bacterium]
MKDDELKAIWHILNEETGFPDSSFNQADYFRKSKSRLIQDKVRQMLQTDLLIKVISGLAFLLNLLVYHDTPIVFYINLSGILFLAIMTAIEVRILRQLERVSDPGLPTRDSLSGILVFLRRKSHLYALTVASTQIQIFVPGLLIYFFIAYGQVKPMTTLSFIVFSVLCLIGTVTSYLRIKAQIKFHAKHITACLSDLNDNILSFVSESIEKQRKHDDTTKILIGLLLIFAFVAFLAVLKSIV